MNNQIELTKIYAISPITKTWRMLIGAWKWLLTTLSILGLLLVATIGYWSFKGMPNCLRTLDAQTQQVRIDQLGEAVSDLQDFKQMVNMKQAKSEALRVKLAQK